jgi:hypothetical protein
LFRTAPAERFRPGNGCCQIDAKPLRVAVSLAQVDQGHPEGIESGGSKLRLHQPWRVSAGPEPKDQAVGTLRLTTDQLGLEAQPGDLDNVEV